MNITPKQQRQMYAIFIALFAVNLGITIISYREQAKLRKLQKELTIEQINNARRKKGEEEVDKESI
jgi:hypothetical protein